MESNDPNSLREVPKTRDPLGADAPLVVALIVLVILVAILWFANLAHRPHGGSRVVWPSPAATKP